MTREEAIQLIDEIASSYYPCDKKDALEMAIKALENLPSETVTEQEIAKHILHKLAVQILEKYSGLDICEHLDEYDWDENDISYYKQVGNIGDIMDMIDNILSEGQHE